MTTRTAPSLRVCLEIEDGRYIAQCVDYDIFAEGDSVDDALDAFVQLYMKYVLLAAELGTEPFETMPPPPATYVQRWMRDAQRGGQVYTRPIPKFAVVGKGQSVPANQFGAVEASMPVEAAA